MVAPDWRGFGDSEWVPGGYWFPDYFADLDGLLDALAPQSRARVIGHSMAPMSPRCMEGSGRNECSGS